MDFVVVAAEPQQRLTRPTDRNRLHLDFSLEVYSSSTEADSSRSPSAAASSPQPPPPPPRLEDAGEFCALVDRVAFFRDLMKSFPALRSGCRSPSRAAPTALVDASFELLDNPNHSANMAPAQWERVERQFRLDVPREELLIDGVRHRDADSAVAAIGKFCLDVLTRCRATVASVESHGPRSDVRPPPCAASPPVGSAGILSWIWPAGIGSSTATTKSQIGVGDDDVAQNSDEGWEFAGITPEQLAREIVLLSQQSVLAFLLESIQVHVISTTRERSSTWNPIIVGEVSPAGRSSASASVPFTSMRVEIYDQKSAPALFQGGSSSPSAMAPVCRADGKPHRPVPVLRVTKYFRVFDIGEEGAQRTLDIVRAELLVELLGSPNDPVQLRWSRVPSATE